MDSASEIYSSYSIPTSRGTSETCSVALPTPLDGLTNQKRSNPAFVGPRIMPPNKAGLVRVHSSRSTVSCYEDEILLNAPEFRSPQECGPEPYEEYFSIPGPKGGHGLDDARRRRSTKELIKRFESISADNSPVSLPGHGTRSTPGRVHRGNPSLFTPPYKAEKKTSPLRQSFRNLLSVFKKGKRFGKERMDSNGILSEPDPPAEGVQPGPLKHESEPDPFTFDGSGPSSRICASPTYSLHRGPLLHLSPLLPARSILPVWVTCDATLHGSHILLTSATTQGIQSTIVVSLRACTDIKSLAPEELAAEHRALLPVMEDSTDPKVFELSFYGKESQRFAAPTVKERAAWVSAIWDVILHKQERRRLERTKVELKSSLRIDVGAVPSQPSPATLPLPETISEQVLIPPDTPFSDSPSFRNREVSPLPQNKPSTHSAISATPPSLMENDPQLESQKVLATSVISVGPRGHISACNDSELTSPTHYRAFSDTSQSFDARAHSPSLVNLGRRSVVRKRLVEMQNGSTSGGSTLRDPRLPPRNTVATLLARGRPVDKATSPVSSRAPSSLIVPSSRMPSPVSAVIDASTLSVTPKSAFRLRDEMRSWDSTVASTHNASESPSLSLTKITAIGHRPSGPQTPVSSLSIDALLDIMDVHAERQLIKTEELDDRLEDVQDGVRNIVANLHVAISRRDEEARNIAELCSEMGNVRSTLASLSTKTSNGNIPEQEEMQPVVKSRAPENTVDGEASSLVAGEHASEFSRVGYGAGIDQADVSDIRRKLDMLLELSDSQKNAACSAKSETTSQSPPKHFDPERHAASRASDQCDAEDRTNIRQETILHDEGKSTQLVEQQAESVRYLNELNAWLEAFVNGSTVQFGAIAEDVQRLCKALGNVDNDLEEGDANFDPTARTMTLLQGVRKLITDNQRRDRDSAHLLTTMNGLAAALSEDMRKNAEMRNAYTTESVLGAIERQRRDQERMLRALASELSDDIRGERLRFVEAMKEATAINVQIHVEEFKKELTREVLISTQEVGRLQRERQLLEQQIADLFAFYSKQKQSALGAKEDAVPQSRSLQPRLQPLDRGPGSPSRGRALPPPPQKRRP